MTPGTVIAGDFTDEGAVGSSCVVEVLRLCPLQLAGGSAERAEGRGGIVGLQRLPRARVGRAVTAAFIVSGIQLCFFIWILLPSHYPALGGSPYLAICSLVMLVSIYAIELSDSINVSTLCLATALARDPIPVAPEPGTRVAFVTTIVPGKEPLDDRAADARGRAYASATTARSTSGCSTRATTRRCGRSAPSSACTTSRARASSSGTMPTGPYRAKTKHGNYNAWLDGARRRLRLLRLRRPRPRPAAQLPRADARLLPRPGRRLRRRPAGLRQLRQPRHQVPPSRQQFLFHALIQRWRNRFGCPMFVGTNNAVRIAALTQHRRPARLDHRGHGHRPRAPPRRNPLTGERWRSVYTPDVLAVGEGPSSWTDFFTQQLAGVAARSRRCRATSGAACGGSRRAQLHYLLMIAYYPSAAHRLDARGLNCVLYSGRWARRASASQPQVWMAVTATWPWSSSASTRPTASTTSAPTSPRDPPASAACSSRPCRRPSMSPR